MSDYVRRAVVAAGLSWPLPEGLDDAALEAALFPALPPSRVPRPEPDWHPAQRYEYAEWRNAERRSTPIRPR